jgi:hypothetical protein
LYRPVEKPLTKKMTRDKTAESLFGGKVHDWADDEAPKPSGQLRSARGPK